MDRELTELTGLDVQRQDGVASPASGFTFLIRESAAGKSVVHFSDGAVYEP